ncbi:NUDIX domain-containing protein [Streptomyces flavidovirens]|uniref:NUDIX domain-containing protein n=1 Tax=Streptomyces flavidovirens TaxID=67298 RepID=A0ABW6RI67_9ACTN
MGGQQWSYGTVGAQIIILTPAEEVLLQLRDNNPLIAFPGTWCIPGGHLEPGEEPRDCVIRELQEEMQLFVAPSDVKHLFSRQRTYGFEHTFWIRRDVDVGQIRLTEGQAVRLHSRTSLGGLTLGYEDHEVLREFFRGLDTGGLP